LPLRLIACQLGGALELRARFFRAAQSLQELCANTVQIQVPGELRLCSELVGQFEACRGTTSHAHCHRPIQLDDWRWHDARKSRIQFRNANPVGIFSTAGAGVARGNRCLQHVRTRLGAQLFSTF
jgi:hypothetical protein